MNPSAASKGNSFAGAVAYITHDVGKDSSERVAHVEVLNMRTADPDKAAKVMAWTAMHADELKEAAGVKVTGRKAGNPVYHFSLNWEPSEKPDHKHMVETAKSALKALGYENHEAVLAVHRDKGHQHIHVVVNRVNQENGKTHNPQNDYQQLQKWAYAYEKAQGRVFCLDRAIKHEPDKNLQEVYKARLAKEQQKGTDRDSVSRPQWEPQHDAPGKQTGGYKAVRDRLDAKRNELAKTGRDQVKRHADERTALKTRHAEERAALWQKQMAAFQARRSFERAANIVPAYTWQAYQADRSQLRALHAREAAQLRAAQDQKHAHLIAAFKLDLKEARREFRHQHGPEALKRLDAALKITAATKVSQHTADHRDRLAGVFNANAEKGDREQQFAAQLDARCKVFYGRLAEKNAPEREALKAQQREAVDALRQKFDQGRAQSRARRDRIDGHREAARQDRADLVARHRDERSALYTRHGEERGAQVQAWAAFNQERTTAWADYKAQRARQQKRQEQDKTDSRGIDRAIAARDYVANDRGQAPGGGREIARRAPG